MTAIKSSVLSLLIVILGSIFISKKAEDPKAVDIVRKADEKSRGLSSEGELTMTIVRPSWSREVSMKSWTLQDDYSLILITAPARDKGTAFLKREKEMWNWQPSIDRIIKLPPSMMSQSWMGSDFTNDDLVNQSSIVNDYFHKMLGEENIEGRDCYIIEMRPKEDVAVTWEKVKMWVDKEEYMELKTEFYDEEDFLINTIVGKEIEMIGGRLLPRILEVVPADKDGHKTIIHHKWLKFDEKMSPQFFSIKNMKRVR